MAQTRVPEQLLAAGQTSRMVGINPSFRTPRSPHALASNAIMLKRRILI